MFQLFQKFMNKKRKKDKGAAIVMVIVALAFIGMLVSMVLYMSYFNYLMKATDKASKNSFYSAETALELINAGLQKDMNECIGKAYVMSTQLSAERSEAEMSALFRNMFKLEFATMLDEPSALGVGGYNASATDHIWQVSHIQGMIGNADDMMKLATTRGAAGAFIEAESPANAAGDGTLLIEPSEFVLKGLKITFVDHNGYVSIIKTDIRVAIPSYDFALATTGLTLENYSIIANDCLVNDESATTRLTAVGSSADSNVYGGMHFGNANTSVTGNVFGGNDGIYVKDQTGLSFVEDADDSRDDYDLIAASLNVENTDTAAAAGLVVDNKHSNYLYNITIDKSGTLSLAGTSYVKDDLDVFGKGAKVKLAGRYMGYGDAGNDSSMSSSIMINGAEADLDFSGLTELKLCGNAFVGATHYDADVQRFASAMGAENAAKDYIKDIEAYNKIIQQQIADGTYTPNENTLDKNENDVLMGESLAVKANQLMYMVPADCIGFVSETNKQVLGKNPLTYDEYTKLTKTYKEGTDLNNPTQADLYYKLYDLSNLSDRMGTAYNVGVRTVFRRVSGNVLVYLYLDFGGNQVEANRFFQDYVRLNPESFDSYVKSYVKRLVWSPQLEADGRAKLMIAGNGFKFNGSGDVVIENNNLFESEDKMQDLYNNIPGYANKSEAMMHMLTTDADSVTSTQLSKTVYENLVDTAAVNDTTKLGNKEFVIGELKAKTVVGDYRYTATDFDDHINVLVATGNVYLDNNFKGLVIAGKGIYVGDACSSVKYDSVSVYNILCNAVDAEGHHAYEIFGTLGKMSYGIGALSAKKGESIKTSSYITYANWKKE